MPRKRPEQVAETRRVFLRSAAKCFAAAGFEKATLKDIASEAGMTVPTLYSYFASKQDLVQALIDQLIAEMSDLFDVLLPRGLTFAQKLELLLAHQLRWSEERRDAFQFLMRLERRDVEEETSTHRQHLDRLEAWLTEHADPEELRVEPRTTALVIDALGNAWFRRWLEDGARPGELIRRAPEYADLVLHGVGTGSLAEE